MTRWMRLRAWLSDAWQLLRHGYDQCAFCMGRKGGMPGNENLFRTERGTDVLVCDYCTVLVQKLRPTLSEAAKTELAGMLETGYSHLVDYVLPNDTDEAFLSDCRRLDEIVEFCRVKNLYMSYEEQGRREIKRSG